MKQNKTLTSFIRFIGGISLGILSYRFVLAELSLRDQIGFIIVITLCLILSFGITFSSHIRCIILLIFPNLIGNIGRNILKALIITFIISGPLENLSNNGREAGRVFACTISLTFNLTKSRFELMFKPFSQAIFGMKAEVNEIKDTLRSVKDVSNQLKGEIEGNELEQLKEENEYLDLPFHKIDDMHRDEGKNIEIRGYEKQYLNKIESRCISQLGRAANKCQLVFQDKYDTCYQTVTWVAAWILCWPMKLDFLCNIAEALGGTSRCDGSRIINSGFGEDYSYLKHSASSLAQRFKNTKLQYKIGEVKQLRNIANAQNTALAILHRVQDKKNILSKILNTIKRILAFMVLRIILLSQDYQEKYLKDIEYDNVYISRYFRRIDARRKMAGKNSLLPLKKIESKNIVDPSAFKPLKSEQQQIFRETFLLLLEMFTATTFILLDRLFYETLDIIQRHSRISYLTTGKHDLHLEIKGSGIFAAILRSLVKSFNVKKRIRIERSNEQCMPKPTRLSSAYLLKIYGTYFTVWILLWIQAYTLRWRRLICAWFFYTWEKKRIIFLYNKMLKRRKIFYRSCKRNAKKKVRELRLAQHQNVLQVLCIKYARQCNWLNIAPRRCLICDEAESRNKISNFVQCENTKCQSVYCRECWKDMGAVCIVCKPSTETEDEMTEDEI